MQPTLRSMSPWVKRRNAAGNWTVFVMILYSRSRLRADRLGHSMAHETTSAKTARVKKIIAGLKKAYPNAHRELNHSNPLELLIATILSAQCTDKRVNLVTPELFKKYRTAKDYANAPQAELENAIKSTGFYRNKTKSIRAATSTIATKFGGKVPDSMEG